MIFQQQASLIYFNLFNWRVDREDCKGALFVHIVSRRV